METIKHGALEQMDLILRLNKFHSNRVIIKLSDGSSIEGWLTGLQPALTAEEFEQGNWIHEFDTKLCYLREEYGTVSIPFGKIADIEGLA